MPDPTTKQLVDSLRGNVCPACGEFKSARHSFCADCYRKLPRKNQIGMYRRIGDGYEQAMQGALALLGATEFKEADDAA